MRIRAIVMVIATIIAAFGIMDAFAGIMEQNSLQANGNLEPLSPALWTGNGEDYLLHLSYQKPVPNYTLAWQNLIQNSSGYSSKFNWKVLRLAFAFSNLNDTQTVDSSLDLAKMDNVIGILASHGYKVILDDHNWAGFGSQAWVQNWRTVAQHYKDDIRIAAFELFNEPTSVTWSKNVTSSSDVGTAYANCTDAIHQIDSRRTVVWNIQFLGVYGGYLAPPQIRNNVVGTFHLYANETTTKVDNAVNGAVKFSQKYNIQTYCGELNVDTANASVTVYEIHSLSSSHIAWIALLYGTYPTSWNLVFKSV